MNDRVFAFVLALAATVGLACGYSHSGWLTLYLAGINCAAIWRWHGIQDWLGFALGATLGNATELAADAAGLWIHSNRELFEVTPPYILLCYPLLWVAGPRLLAPEGLHAPSTSGSDAAYALVIWAAHCALCCRHGASETWLIEVNLVAASALLLRFRKPADLWCAGLGGALGLVWEIPCTWSGAWRFPHPSLAGLIPAWLPVAYAVFFLSLNRARVYVCSQAEEWALGSHRVQSETTGRAEVLQPGIR